MDIRSACSPGRNGVDFPANLQSEAEKPPVGAAGSVYVASRIRRRPEAVSGNVSRAKVFSPGAMTIEAS
jgi:hypothetical protein